MRLAVLRECLDGELPVKSRSYNVDPRWNVGLDSSHEY